MKEAGRIGSLLDVQWVVVSESLYPWSDEWSPSGSGEFNPTLDANEEALSSRLINVRIQNLTDNPIFSSLQAGYAASGPLPDDGPLSLRDASFRDSLWITGISVLTGNTTDPSVLKDIIPNVAEDFSGASGNILLDVNGDRAANFEFYQVRQNGGTIDWVKIGWYDALADRVILQVNP
jgi:hypothetical protein